MNMKEVRKTEIEQLICVSRLNTPITDEVVLLEKQKQQGNNKNNIFLGKDIL